MSIQVAVSHRTTYQYERSIIVNPQIIRLRPAPHCRTQIDSYSLNVAPRDHFLNWQQDPVGNFQARVVFPDPIERLTVEVDFTAELVAINPFDFFLEQDAETFPFEYDPVTAAALVPYLGPVEAGDQLVRLVQQLRRPNQHTVDFLVEVNKSIYAEVDYQSRMTPGIQDCEETIASQRGSCRDMAWLLVQVLRHLGLAARFTSGYLVQLTPDEPSVNETSEVEEDGVDFHAWAEVFVPGAGWIGMDPTSGLLAGEGHIPVACAPDPAGASPISGRHETCRADFSAALEITRVSDPPRPSAPFSDRQWDQIVQLGSNVDRRLDESDVRLTMGSEPTFVSLDDRGSGQWQTEALGEEKLRLAEQLAERLKDKFAPRGLLHHGQGKQYPGEPLPRWAIRCIWRTDGEPLWTHDEALASSGSPWHHHEDLAKRLVSELAQRLGAAVDHIMPAHESDAPEKVAGFVLPLKKRWWESPQWQSERWTAGALTLESGDSPIGFRLPLDALAEAHDEELVPDSFPVDPFDTQGALASRQELWEQAETSLPSGSTVRAGEMDRGQVEAPELEQTSCQVTPAFTMRSAFCVEQRGATVCVFLPPVDRLDDFLQLITTVESVAVQLGIAVRIEGYPPPQDSRLQQFAVTPDPGVIEVNIHPAEDWTNVTSTIGSVYRAARECRLTAEKFESDGTQTGTGGGNHLVLGGATPDDSPFLRRPDLLKSLIGFWHNHPSLSYFFAGRFVGPTSQAPRIDEGTSDVVHELELAFDQIQTNATYPPWHIDRVFRRLLMDRTGNRHRSEFCIDKLFAPECTNGRLGLLELRAFEMSPSARMNILQQLLIRALIAQFWEHPYQQPLVQWGSTLHDRFMLPHFLWQDLCDVLSEAENHDLKFDSRWFLPQLEFRFPKIGMICHQGVEIELRHALEPWYVIDDDSGGTARYVDSSIERLQVIARGMTHPRHVLCCNGRPVPLHATGVEGEYVAGVRFRAWQPPSCTHPTIPVDDPISFDLVDGWLKRSLGGCRYFVSHPGGMGSKTLPASAEDAESRRAARFVRTSHLPGVMDVPVTHTNPQLPLTLDLRISPTAFSSETTHLMDPCAVGQAGHG